LAARVAGSGPSSRKRASQGSFAVVKIWLVGLKIRCGRARTDRVKLPRKVMSWIGCQVAPMV
jgi:hypothetical protein